MQKMHARKKGCPERVALRYQKNAPPALDGHEQFVKLVDETDAVP